jgi:hypothetical protein
LTKIEIVLDKPEYSIGETVNGKFKLSHGGFLEKPVDAKITLNAIGMERAEVMKTIIVPRTDANGNTTEVEQHQIKYVLF